MEKFFYRDPENQNVRSHFFVLSKKEMEKFFCRDPKHQIASFKDIEQYRIHLAICRGLEPFKCPVCKMRFNTKLLLSIHNDRYHSINSSWNLKQRNDITNNN